MPIASKQFLKINNSIDKEKLDKVRISELDAQNNKKELNNSLEWERVNIAKKNQDKKNTLIGNLGIFQYYCRKISFLLGIKMNLKEEGDKARFNMHFKIIHTLQDYFYFLEKSREVDLLKNLILNENQINALKLISMNKFADLSKLISENHEVFLSNIYNYFEDLQSKGQMMKTDQIIFDMLNSS
jgi:hypothetical protein